MSHIISSSVGGRIKQHRIRLLRLPAGSQLLPKMPQSRCLWREKARMPSAARIARPPFRHLTSAATNRGHPARQPSLLPCSPAPPRRHNEPCQRERRNCDIRRWPTEHGRDVYARGELMATARPLLPFRIREGRFYRLPSTAGARNSMAEAHNLLQRLQDDRVPAVSQQRSQMPRSGVSISGVNAASRTGRMRGYRWSTHH